MAEVLEQDLVIENGKVEAYRTKLKVSFNTRVTTDRLGPLLPLPRGEVRSSS